MKKIICVVLCLVLLASGNMVLADSAFIANNDVLFCQEYVVNVMSKLQNGSFGIPVIENYRVLLDVETDAPVAIAFSFEEEKGFAIIGIDNLYLYEASFEESSPYMDVDITYNVYYNGYFEYFFKKDGKFIRTESAEQINQSTKVCESEQCYDSLISVMDESSINVVFTNAQKMEMISRLKDNDLSRATIPFKRISGILSTSWENGLCGPTSAFVMLKYKGRVESGYTDSYNIYKISEFTGREVTLTTLKNGINEYLNAKGFSGSVASSGFNFTLVRNEINSNEPLTLGTSAHYEDGEYKVGHVQTIWGYEATYDGTFTTYIMYVNDSHGSNGDIISYRTTPNSWLADHVYFTS